MYIPTVPVVPLRALPKLFAAGRTPVPQFAMPPNVTLHASGRCAIAHALTALGVDDRSVAWVPAYICQSAVDPVVRRGLPYKYYDINANFEPDDGALAPRDEDVVFLVNYFGVTRPLSPNRAGTPWANCLVVEDGAHTLPWMFGGHCGRFSDAAIFSLRKMLGVPDGGMLIVNRVVDGAPTEDTSRPAVYGAASGIGLLAMAVRSVAFRLGVNVMPAFEWIRRSGVHVDGAGPDGISRHAAWLLQDTPYEVVVARRRENYRFLRARLEQAMIPVPIPELPSEAIPEAMPILHARSRALVERLRRRGVEAYRWPGDDLPPDVEVERFPGTKMWAEQGVMLPVHHGLSETHLRKVADLVAAEQR